MLGTPCQLGLGSCWAPGWAHAGCMLGTTYQLLHTHPCYLLQVRVVWYANLAENFNVSIPYLQVGVGQHLPWHDTKAEGLGV